MGGSTAERMAGIGFDCVAEIGEIVVDCDVGGESHESEKALKTP
jgi:hypothetical protein